MENKTTPEALRVGQALSEAARIARHKEPTPLNPRMVAVGQALLDARNRVPQKP